MLLTTSLTTIEPLYTAIGGNTTKEDRRVLKESVRSLVAVIVVVGIAPSPALMEVIPIGSPRRSQQFYIHQQEVQSLYLLDSWQERPDVEPNA